MKKLQFLNKILVNFYIKPNKASCLSFVKKSLEQVLSKCNVSFEWLESSNSSAGWPAVVKLSTRFVCSGSPNNMLNKIVHFEWQILTQAVTLLCISETHNV